jgi:uncharacterized protein YraI
MSRLHQIAIATILGLSTPIFATSFHPTPVMAEQAQKLDGTFADDQWSVSIIYRQNDYKYYAVNLKSRSEIKISDAIVSGTRDRRTYSWNNGGTRYQAIWQQRDPDFLRVRVFSPQGKEILNRLLKRQGDDC